MDDVAGLRICDLACGQGRAARYLVDRGASVVGIDVSAKLLEFAHRYEAEQPRGIEYRQLDAHLLENEAAAEFDGVLCFMSLMDIDELESTLPGVHHILKPGGWFVFAVLHPCFNTSMHDVLKPNGRCHRRLRDLEHLLRVRPRYDVRDERLLPYGRLIQLEDWPAKPVEPFELVAQR